MLANSSEVRTRLGSRSLATIDWQVVAGVAFVLLVTGIGVALTMQGWRSRIPAFDLLTYIYSGREFLASGTLPQHGDTGSYGSFKPAGTAWLMMPSMLLFDDPRLSEYVGTALLHFATLLGLFFIARHYFNLWCAYLAVLLYGLSHHGLFLAGSLWPNGRPDFYVWIVLFVTLWVSRKDGKFLAAAGTVGAVGMQVDMGIAPAIFIFPAVWLFYRPPVRLAPLLVGAALALLVWAPYLRFEAGRGFVDLRSQLLLQGIFPAENYTAAWCEPERVLHRYEAPGDAAPTYAPVYERPAATQAQALQRVGSTLWEKLRSNYVAVASIPGASTLLLLLTLTGMVGLTGSRRGDAAELFISRRLWRPWFTLAGVGMIVVGLAFNEALVARYLSQGTELDTAVISKIHRVQSVLLLGGIILLLEKPLARLVGHIWRRTGGEPPTDDRAERTRLLALCLGVPWVVLLLVAEPGKPERFWWIWPLQILFLAAAITVLLPRLRVPQRLTWAVLVSIVAVILVNPFMQWRVSDWWQEGWSGHDADQVRVVEYVADQIEAAGRDEAAIGYQTFIYRFMAAYHVINPQYKVGAEFDLLFSQMEGVTNTNRCAEGLSPEDEYRIVQVRPEPDPAAPREYFDMSIGENYRLLRQFGSYRVYTLD